MSKPKPHKTWRNHRRHFSTPLAHALSSIGEEFSRLITGGHGKNKLKPISKLAMVSGLMLVVMVALVLWAGPMANTVVAQDAVASTWTANTGDAAWITASSALVLFMTPGLAFFYGGLVRSRNVLNTMMMSLVAMAIVGVLWVLWGYSLAFDVTLAEGQKFANGIQRFIGGLGWLGLNGVAFDAADPIGYAPTIPHMLFMLYQMMFAIITVALISGAIVERISFKAFFWFIILWSTFIYSPLAHMVWGRGLLGAMGVLDFAGGTVVHISAGVSALVAAWVLGPRKDWMVKPIVPHNVPYVLLGVGILWFGWFGFNGGSAFRAGPLAVVAVSTTTIAAAAGGLTWAVAEWILKSKPTAIGIGSGFVSGLVGITPAAGFVNPLSAIAIGGLTSLVCFFVVNLKAKLQFDDSLDTFPVHGVGGTVGAIATGFFANKAVNPAGFNGLLFGNPNQLSIQVVAVLIAWFIAGVGTWIILQILAYFMDLRVSEQIEEEGLDVHLHGEEAYGEKIAGEISFARRNSD